MPNECLMPNHTSPCSSFSVQFSHHADRVNRSELAGSHDLCTVTQWIIGEKISFKGSSVQIIGVSTKSGVPRLHI
jgi:hypothetical protein